MKKILQNKLNKIFNKNKDINTENAFTKEFVIDSIREQINDINQLIQSLTSVKEYLEFYSEKVEKNKYKWDMLIREGEKEKISIRYKLISYRDSLRIFNEFLLRYMDNESDNLFLRFFIDDLEDLLLIFSDYTKVLHKNNKYIPIKEALYIYGLYKSSNINVNKGIYDENRLYIYGTYYLDDNEDGAVIEINKIRAGERKRGCRHGEYSMKCLVDIINEINIKFRKKEEHNLIIKKVWGYIRPDDDKDYGKLVEFYKKRCNAMINNGEFQIVL